MTSTHLSVTDTNLSHAWAQAFLALMQPGAKALGPLVVTVTGFPSGRPDENPAIREALDRILRDAGFQSCRTVASTIFPDSLWNPALGRNALFERYRALLPKLRRDHRNHYGTYFERLTTYGSGRYNGNQLEQLITSYTVRGNTRRSALQAAVFDPARDLTDQRQRGFPCLQHVAFTPNGEGGLAVTGFYASQWLVERAYGNFLGLAGLGRFMAHELNLELTQLTCVAAYEVLGDGWSKRSLAPLAGAIGQVLSDAEHRMTLRAPPVGAAD